MDLISMLIRHFNRTNMWNININNKFREYKRIGSCGCCYTQFTGTGFKAKGVDLFCCKVIGNIYENKELLEG